jgi:hypothetical protein
MTTASERAYFDACADRPALSDEDFYHRFYADSEVTLETCARVRRVLCEQLRMCNTLPDDNVALIFGDVDIAEVCFEIADACDVTFPDGLIHEIDGTVDSLIRATQRLNR